tara:strand:- start:115 stop:327 length:213 start_codon:yes stop_codon:yes gene_type:complete
MKPAVKAKQVSLTHFNQKEMEVRDQIFGPSLPPGHKNREKDVKGKSKCHVTGAVNSMTIERDTSKQPFPP